jgi:circadian clock protein KaiC
MENSRLPRISCGVSALDTVLQGGLVTERLYLVMGKPGTGKTLLGMEFLRAGLDNGEQVLFIHGEESQENLLQNGSELGIDLADAEFLDIGPESDFFDQTETYDIVDPQGIEDEHLIQQIRTAIEEIDPDRILLDPISHLQYIEPTENQFRKRIIAFMRFLKDRGTTVLATKTSGSQMEEQLQSLSDGVFRLERGDTGRRISVLKHRGVGQQDGSHGLAIRSNGIEVFPTLVPEDHNRTFEPTQYTSGIEGLDALLGGGLEQGTVTIISGPTGVGKSSTATEFMHTAAVNDKAPLAYLFEESLDTFMYRSETFGIPITQLCDTGALTVEEIEPLTLSPEEFAQMVKAQVEAQQSQLVVIDGIEGYKTAIQGDEKLTRELHALTRYLKNMNVTVILLDELSNVTGVASPTSSNVSYLADNIILQKYIEMDGHLRRVIGVLKKRVGGFEDQLREFQITGEGVEIGEPLTHVQGILDGKPEWRDTNETVESSD